MRLVTITTILSVLVLVVAPSGAQESKPAGPSDVVRAFGEASKTSDYGRMAEHFAEPMAAICRTAASFLRVHGQFLAVCEKTYGEHARQVLNDKRFEVQFTSFEGVEAGGEEIKGDDAVVLAKLELPGKRGKIDARINLVRVKGAWKILGVDDRRLADDESAENYLLQWSVAEEATRRALAEVKAGRAKTAKDAGLFREAELKTITAERVRERQSGLAPTPKPGGHAPLKASGAKPVPNPHAPTSRPASRPAAEPKKP